MKKKLTPLAMQKGRNDKVREEIKQRIENNRIIETKVGSLKRSVKLTNHYFSQTDRKKRGFEVKKKKKKQT